MKQLLVLLLLGFSFVISAEDGVSSDYIIPNQAVPAPIITADSPQVCQFSLSKYTGKVAAGSTERFTVGLSCPQESDTYATVVALINGSEIASTVVKISSGKTRSESVSISVGSSYNDQTYRLIVQ